MSCDSFYFEAMNETEAKFQQALKNRAREIFRLGGEQWDGVSPLECYVPISLSNMPSHSENGIVSLYTLNEEAKEIDLILDTGISSK